MSVPTNDTAIIPIVLVEPTPEELAAWPHGRPPFEVEFVELKRDDLDGTPLVRITLPEGRRQISVGVQSFLRSLRAISGE